jgi:RNA polymerase sigma-70 factor, ECF subfamily
MEPSAAPFSDLVERYYALLYRYAYRLTGSAADAEDLTQHAFATAHAKWNQLHDESKAKSWLFTIARNAYLKSLRRPQLVSTETCADFPAPGSDDKSHIDSERLQAALNSLAEEYRTPIILFYFEEFSYQEIADQMEVPLGTVMSRLARAKAHLRQSLGQATELAATAGQTSPVSPNVSRASR